MKKLALLCLIFALTIPARAQVTIKQVVLNNVTGTGAIGEEELMNRFTNLTTISISELQQRAAEAVNIAKITTVGSGNTTNISQSGTGLLGVIHINGYDNNAITLNQTGSNLLSLIDVRGNSNRLDMIQSGNNLGNLVEVEGSGILMELTQDESGFRYLQTGAVNPISITSTSRYVPIIISNK